MSTIKELLPEGLYAETYDSEFQRWLRCIDNMLSRFTDAMNTEKRNYIISTMEDGIGLDYWEKILGLIIDPALTIDDRRGRIFTYLSGTNGTAQDVKNVIISYIPEQTSIEIRPRKDFIPSPDITENYTYDVIVEVPNVSVITINFELLKESIRKVHPAHCVLGDVTLSGQTSQWDVDDWDDPTHGWV